MQSELKDRHTLAAAAVFRLKRLGRQAQRGIQNLVDPPSQLEVSSERFGHQVYESRSLLRKDEDQAERLLTLGKIENLRRAVRRIDGLVLEAGEVLSFWQCLGRMTRAKGYVVGREIREGCIVPTVGGGICQLSNALYQAALATGCEIVERHAHTLAVPGSNAAFGTDATVAWNDIDLRFRAGVRLQIRCFLTSEELVVRFLSDQVVGLESGGRVFGKRGRTALPMAGVGNCVTCGETECFRHAPRLRFSGEAVPTFLMDSAWPEWKALVIGGNGRLMVPRRGRTGSRYDWGPGARDVFRAAAERSWRARKVAGQAPAVVRAGALENDARVGEAMGRRLGFRDDELVVAQSLSAGLWRSGALAGRRYRVVMTRPPLGMVHRLLDEAAMVDPDAGSLTDFRADDQWVRWEDEALAGSQGLITAHCGLASVLEGDIELVDWVGGGSQVDREPERLVVLPGPAIARNGSKAVREAARQLGLKVAVLGSFLEDRELWEGVELVSGDGWERKALAVVQPSVFETRPGVLLRAIRAGVPVISGAMCGLERGEFEEVAFGDVEGLTRVLESLLAQAGLG